MSYIIETGGKQYIVSSGEKLKIEKIKTAPDGKVSFDKILLSWDGKKVEIGKPYLPDVSVKGEVLKEGREKKKIIFKYHSKTRLRKKKSHRQEFAEVLIF